MAKTFILTEEQVVRLCEVDSLCESLNESVSFKDIVKKVKYALAAGVAAASLLTAINNLSISIQEKNALKDMVEQANMQQSVFEQKVQAVEDCMRYYMKLMGKDFNKIPMSPEKMVQVSEDYNFDLPLMLAQAKCESVFGTEGRCMRSNSAFAVGAWDNGEDKVTYSDVNNSIEPYVQLMQNDYLSGKSVQDLLKDGGFVNNLNMRYASDENYERKIRGLRNTIQSKWPILAQ